MQMQIYQFPLPQKIRFLRNHCSSNIKNVQGYLSHMGLAWQGITISKQYLIRIVIELNFHILILQMPCITSDACCT